jgi:hypothetical protein
MPLPNHDPVMDKMLSTKDPNTLPEKPHPISQGIPFLTSEEDEPDFAARGLRPQNGDEIRKSFE